MEQSNISNTDHFFGDFNDKFRHSWRKTAEEFALQRSKFNNINTTTTTTTNNNNNNNKQLSENNYHPQQLIEDSEEEMYQLQEEIQQLRFQNNELQVAISEAQTIIDQQQNQLTEFRRRAAQLQTDADAFKMKNMFLTSGSQTHDEQVSALIMACERLEAEIEALTWQLEQTKKSFQNKQTECEQLKQIIKQNSNLNEYNNNNQNQNAQFLNNHENYDNDKNQIILNDLENQLKQLQIQLIEYENKQLEWNDERENLLNRQKALEQDRKTQSTIIQQMIDEQNDVTNTEQNNENHINDNNNNSISQNSDHEQNESRSELLDKIKELNEEKSQWKLYASSLVRTFVENCDEFIRKTQYDEPYFETVAERRWYTYSMQLLENLLSVAPYLLSRMDLQLLRRNSSTKQQTIQLTNTPINRSFSPNEPQILTSSDFPINSAPNTVSPNNRRKSITERAARLATTPILQTQDETYQY